MAYDVLLHKTQDELDKLKSKVEFRSKDSVYIKLNGWIYYIDDSTNEQIINKWRDDE